MDLFSLINIHKTYIVDKKTTPVLKSINLSFPQSGLICIKGKSGCGKSTLLNLLARIEKPSEGEILYKGERLSSFSKSRLSSYRNFDISLIYQHYNLIEEETAINNVALPLLIRGDKEKDVYKEIEKLFFRFNIPHLMNKKVQKLSGGEKQRIAILRAISSNSSVILCDEPTGALDSQNSVLIMDILKEISKDKLVIMVSHNEELIKKYADNIIELRNGKVSSIKEKELNRTPISKTKVKNVRGNTWTKLFTKRNLLSNLKKNLMCLSASLVGLVATILSIGFSVGSNSAIKTYQKRSLDFNHAIIQEKAYQKIEGSPLSLVQLSRPELEKLNFLYNNFSSLNIELSYSSLIPSYPNLYINNTFQETSEFIPVFDLTLSNFQSSLIVDGIKPFTNSLNEVIVNKEFVNKYFKDVTPINQEIEIENEINIKYPIIDSERSYINDSFAFKKKMKIAAVCDEFSFMNTPKIYYSYLALSSFMSSYRLNEVSEYLNKDFTCYDLVNEAGKNNPYSSYCYEIFVEDDQEIDKLYKLIQELEKIGSPISLSSSPYTISLAYSNLVNTFSLSMYVFIFISLIGVMFIFGIVSYSSFIKKKKESAILTCLGAKEEHIIDIFTNESVLVALFTSILSLLIAQPLSKLANKFLANEFGIKDIIRIPYSSFLNIPYFLLVLIVGISVFVSFISTYVPIKTYKNFSIAEELRDE